MTPSEMRKWRNWKCICLSVVGVFVVILTWALTKIRLTAWQTFDTGSELVPTLSTHPLVDSQLGPLNTADTVQGQLRAAEMIWARSNAGHNEALKRVKLQNGIDKPHNTILWDLFYPSFPCPYVKERIGRVGDGGKWICGFDQLIYKKNCVVFSFGVRADTSFEEEILSRTQFCVVYMFDPTIVSEPPILQWFPGRAFYHALGIGDKDEGNFATLQSIMASLSIKELDVLKMDVEGAEWEAVRRMVHDFKQHLPFAQALIEVHLNGFKSTEWLRILSFWVNLLEEAGLRQFFQEPNLLNENRFSFREMAFLNIKMEPFKMSTLVRTKQFSASNS